MFKMPKDYSRHQNKLIGNLSVKAVVSLGFTVLVLVSVVKSSMYMPLKVVLSIILSLMGLLFAFFKSTEGDDFVTYLYNVFMYYSTPKHLVYKKKIKNEGE